jgi:hypothetical protein
VSKIQKLTAAVSGSAFVAVLVAVVGAGVKWN